MAKRKTQKLGPKQEKWLRMLESGKFKQAHGTLFDGDDSYCCLGIASLSVGLTPDEDHKFDGEMGGCAPPRVVRELQLRSDTGDRADKGDWLTLINDQSKPFPTIAALIRAEPEQYFKKPA